MADREQPSRARRNVSWRWAGWLAVILCGALPIRAAENTSAVPPPAPPSNRIFEAPLGDFSGVAYQAAVDAVLEAFERESGRRLVPGEHGRAGLKVYAESGAGLATPQPLVRALILALERRGFARDSLFILGLNSTRLRQAGFLPPLGVGGDSFEGVPVLALDSGSHYDPAWFYDSPLPSTRSTAWLEIDDEEDLGAVSEAERHSLLPTPLLFGVDFWINLPACSDHPVLGVNGALVNASLWNASNTQRFFRSPANGPAAAAEIAAIPELRSTWVCTILSLERYQFIGGPIFNSLYTLSEPRLWLSDNPVLIDALMQRRINDGRDAAGFRGLARNLSLLAYSQQVGLGAAAAETVEWVRVTPDGR